MRGVLRIVVFFSTNIFSMKLSMNKIIKYVFILGFHTDPFTQFSRRHGRNVNSSRRAPQQMTLFDNFFSPMRMSIFDHNSFAGDYGGNDLGSVSSFNFSFGFVLLSIYKQTENTLFFFFPNSSGGAGPASRKTTKSIKTVNGRRVTTTR